MESLFLKGVEWGKATSTTYKFKKPSKIRNMFKEQDEQDIVAGHSLSSNDFCKDLNKNIADGYMVSVATNLISGEMRYVVFKDRKPVKDSHRVTDIILYLNGRI